MNHNKAFVKVALRCALNSLLKSNLEDESGIRELFDSAILQVATSQMVMSKIAKALVNDHAVLTPIANFTAEAGTSGVANSARESVAVSPHRHHRGLNRLLTRR